MAYALGIAGLGAGGVAVFITHVEAGPVPFQVDGDYLGTADHLALAHTPSVLDVLVPLIRPGTGRRRLRPRLRRGR